MQAYSRTQAGKTQVTQKQGKVLGSYMRPVQKLIKSIEYENKLNDSNSGNIER